jgi:tetratricopeptide (TPR) repeat protein/transcriptional regulator with XRE-family HTH domain
MASFGQLLRSLRRNAGMTQEELADASTVSTRAISDLERGVNISARKDTAQLLADALKLTGPERAEFEAASRRRDLPDGFAAPTKTLPRDTLSFTGREPELRELGGAVKGAGGVVAIYAIGGMAGVGKTALAVHAAHQLVPQFPDGQIYLQLHAHTAGRDSVEPADALASLLQTVGVGAAQIPADQEARASLWRDRVVGKRLLLVLDDAADSDHVRPLLPGTAGSLVLVTSRNRLTALEGAVVISLDALPPEEAAELLVRLAARPGLDVSSPAVAEICRSCGYLPLAIGLVAGRMHHHASWSTEDFATDLAAAQDRLAPMHAENLSVAAAFDLSYRDLRPDQQRLFRRLGLHPGTDIDAYAAAALDDIGLNAARTQLEGLFDHYLLAEPARDRYRLHDLIREYARQLASTDLPQNRADAVARLLDYYLYTVDVASQQLRRGERAGAAGKSKHVKPGHVPEIAGRSQAIEWLSAERLNLHAVTGAAALHNKPAHAGAIPAAMHTFFRTQGYWDQAMTLHHSALDIAREIGARQAEARALTDLGDMQYLSDNYPAAEGSLRDALRMCTELDDRLGQADALRELGAVQLARSEHNAAEKSLTTALEKYMSLNDRIGEADSLRELGAVQQACGHYQDAAGSLDRALTLYRKLDDRLGEADALSDIGTVRLACGDYDSATRSQQQALRNYQMLGDRLGEANALTHLGTVQQMSGAHAEAQASLDRAVELYQGLGDQSGEAEALNNLGELALRTTDYGRARELHGRALAIATTITAPREQARAHEGIGRSYLSEGDLELGETSVRQAVQIYQQIGSPHATRAAKLLRGHGK